jgi:hypothetical protein
MHGSAVLQPKQTVEFVEGNVGYEPEAAIDWTAFERSLLAGSVRS